VTAGLRVLVDGLSFGESPRWHGDRLWFCDWGAERLMTVDLDGQSEVIASVPSFPFCIDWLPDGRLLIVSARRRAIVTLDDDGTLATFADLSGLSANPPNNEIVVDGAGHIYVDGGGFDLMAGEPPAPGMIALVTPDGRARPVADDIHFGNGMAVTPDNATLIVAESHGCRLTAFDIAGDGSLSHRRVWADLGEDPPDGICVDAEGAVWYADVPHGHCVRVREGGEVLQTVDVDRGCFACMLGGPDGRTLFVVAREWHGRDFARGDGTGQVLAVAEPAPAPRAGWP
jgi:sugar lactone lactonase YvrE